MTTRGGRAFRGTLIGCGLAAAIGGGLLLYSYTLPVYNVPYEKASAAFADWCGLGAEADDKIGAQYQAMFGWRYPLTNAGMSILLGAITTAALSVGLWLGRQQGGRDDWRSTPIHGWTFILIGVGAVGLLLAGVANGLDTDLRRQMFPPCADSIGIPMMGLMMTGLLLTPILAIVGWLMTRGFGNLPTALSCWDEERPRRSWTVTVLFGFLIVATLGAFLAGIATSDMVSPAIVVIVYLLAATRAALLAPDRDPFGSAL